MNADLNSQIQAMVEFVRDLAPEVRVEHANVIYEDEHANLKVYPPLTWDEDRCLALQHRIAEKVMDVHIASGLTREGLLDTLSGKKPGKTEAYSD